MGKMQTVIYCDGMIIQSVPGVEMCEKADGVGSESSAGSVFAHTP